MQVGHGHWRHLDEIEDAPLEVAEKNSQTIPLVLLKMARHLSVLYLFILNL
jgi:hypothetical protein